MHRWRFRFFSPLVPALVLISVFIPTSWAIHAMMCIGDAQRSHSHYNSRAVSIGSGAKRAFLEAGELYSATDGLSEVGNEECFDRDRSHTLTIYPIRYKSADVENPESNVLFGWFHLHLKAHVEGISILVMQPFVNVKTDAGESYAAGEFVSTGFKAGVCKETMGAETKGPDLSYRQALAPCFFAPNPTTTVPTVFAYAIKSGNDVNTKLFEARLNFRTDFPECGQMTDLNNFEFRAYASIQTGHTDVCGYGPQLTLLKHSKIIFDNKIYGAYDPEPPKDHDGVTCDKELATRDPDWVSDYHETIDYPLKWLSGVCYEGALYHKDGSSFVGRCGRDVTGKSDWIVTHSNQYTCDKHHPGVVDLPPFKPPFPGGGINCTEVELKCKNETNKVTTEGITANSIIGRYVWSFRTSHGIAMSLTAMFVIPVGTLFARFFKETHMNFRFINIHVWYGIHISLGMTGFSGLLSGAVAAVIARAFFGYSWHPVAYFHDICGWISLILFLVSLVNAPIRRFKMMYRKWMIFAHFFTASAARILFTICLLSSFYISASPAALNDIDTGFKFERDIVIVVVWIVADVAVHLFLQFQLWNLEISKKRKYALGVPIPRIRPYTTQDVPKSKIRNIVILFHAVFTFACAGLLSILMCLRDPEGRRFGRMGYTHKPNGKLNKLFTDSADGDNER